MAVKRPTKLNPENQRIVLKRLLNELSLNAKDRVTLAKECGKGRQNLSGYFLYTIPHLVTNTPLDPKVKRGMFIGEPKHTFDAFIEFANILIGLNVHPISLKYFKLNFDDKFMLLLSDCFTERDRSLNMGNKQLIPYLEQFPRQRQLIKDICEVSPSAFAALIRKEIVINSWMYEAELIEMLVTSFILKLINDYNSRYIAEIFGLEEAQRELIIREKIKFPDKLYDLPDLDTRKKHKKLYKKQKGGVEKNIGTQPGFL